MQHEIQERAWRFGRDVMRYAVACESASFLGRELLRQLFRARKEAFESRHWLRLRQDMCPSDPALPGLQQEADEVCRVLSAILRSANRSASRGQ